MRPLFVAWILFGCLLVGCQSQPASGRVKVALLDSTPVYHWVNFPSVYRNDVDRALILRDFQLHGFHLPEEFIDKAVQEKIDRDFGGDRARFMAELQRMGETMDNYRQFTGEELILKAMRKRETIVGHDGHPPIPEADWLASLRKGAKVQMIAGERPN
ncbi:MAG: hypothetical protein ACREIF_15665 [Chthoniobacterales bacterium]